MGELPVPAAGTLGEATLTITTDDLGHAGTGGNQTDIDTIAITVAPAAYAPSPVHPILPATLDPSYNGTGKQTLSLSAGTDSIRDMHVTDEGKIIAVGSVNNLFGIIRFNADMTLDNTFGTGGFTATDLGAGVHATALTVDASGRSIVVGGQKIVRYTADGLLDETFGTAGVATDDLIYRAHDVTLEANGEILVTGDVFEAEFANTPTSSYSQILREIDRELKVVRYSTEGIRQNDWTFNADEGLDQYFTYSGGTYGNRVRQDAGQAILSRDDGSFLIAGRGYRRVSTSVSGSTTDAEVHHDHASLK